MTSHKGQTGTPSKTVQEIIDRSSHCIVTDGAGNIHDAVRAKISDLRQLEVMLSHADAAGYARGLEDAAKVCDKYYADLVAETRQHLDRSHYGTANELHQQAQQAKYCAADIRALLPAQGKEGA